MTISELWEVLRREGFEASTRQIRYALLTGRLGSVSKDGAGNYKYNRGHLQRMRSYLQSPRRRGRKPRWADPTWNPKIWERTLAVSVMSACLSG